jgi:atypical dual specificity phosphatase
MATSMFAQLAKITDHLYLGSFIGATESNIAKNQINCVITVCQEVPKFTIKNVESIKLNVLDKPNESLVKYFDFVADKIHEVEESGNSCLVHCVAGVSRSATMVIAYLMKHKKMNLRDAHLLVKSKRPFIRPNMGFWTQLIDYEKRLFGNNTIKIVSSPIGFIPDIYLNEAKNLQWPNVASNNNETSITPVAVVANNTTTSTSSAAAAAAVASANKDDDNFYKIPNSSNFYINVHNTQNKSLKERKNISEPVFGNAIKKPPQSHPNAFTDYHSKVLAPNESRIINNNSNTLDELAKKFDKATTIGTYTTTYRSSFQKP